MGFTLKTALEIYVPETPWNKEGDSDPLTFHYKVPDFGLMSKFMPKTKVDVNHPENTSTEIELDLSARVFDAVIYCLERVTGLYNPEGKPIEIPQNVMKKTAFINSLPSELVFALGNHILSTLNSGGDTSEKKE